MPIGNPTLLALHILHEQERIKKDYQSLSTPLVAVGGGTSKRLRRGVIFLVVIAAALAFWQSAYAQGRQCRDFDQITVCADQLADTGGIAMEGNITVGMKGGEPVIRVVNTHLDDTDPFFVSAGFLNGTFPAGGNMPQLIGAIEFINAPVGERLLQSTLLADQGTAAKLDSTGLFFVDTKTGRIYNPAEGEVPVYEQFNMPRNGTLAFPFLSNTGFNGLIREEDPIELADIDVEINLKERAFHATIPFDLDMPAEAENKKISVTARVTIDEEGNFIGGIDGFKMQAAGLQLTVQGVHITQGTTTQSASFRAEQVDVLRSENPGMPNLDPEHPDLVFRLTDLGYVNGKWSLGGGEVPVPNWQLGPLRLFNSTVGLTLDDTSGTYTFNIRTSLGGVDPNSLVIFSFFQEVNLELGARLASDGALRPFMQTELPAARPNVLVSQHVNLYPEGFTIIIDPAGNFHGIQSPRVALEWGLSYKDFGSQPDQRVSVDNFLFGVDNNKNLIFELGGGTIEMPQLETGILSGRLSGSVAVEEGTLTLRFSGNVQVKIQGNAAISTQASLVLRSGGKAVVGCIPETMDCLPVEETSLTGFGFKLAGFTVQVDNPRSDHGGFAADRALLKLPLGISGTGVEITGLIVDRNGTVIISGGSIELPPLEINGYQFVGLKGKFVHLQAGGYRFDAKGTVPLPGLDPTSNKKITADVSIGSSNFGVGLTFKTNSPGIPIAGTGMELLEIGGRFDLDQGTAKITVNMMAATQARVIGLPLATARGQAVMQLKPFFINANAQLSVLIIDVANASIGIGAGQGFNGAGGAHVRFDVDVIVVRGTVDLRLGDVVLSNGREEFRWTAEALLDVGVRKNQFGRFLPPANLNVGDASLRGGSFQHADGRERAGLLGSVKCCFFFRASLFFDFSSKRVSFVNADDYKLIGSQQVRALASQGMAGYRSHMMSDQEIHAAGLLLAADVDRSRILQDTIPVTVDQRGATLFGIDYPSGSPQIRLQLPDGTILTEADVDDVTSTFIRGVDEETNTSQLAFILDNSAPGDYTILLDNAPDTYEKVSYTINNAPDATIISTTCVSPIGSDPKVEVHCGDTTAGNFTTVTWQTADSDSPDAQVYIGYAPLHEGGDTVDLTRLHVLEENLPLGNGSYSWLLTEVPTGKYKFVVTVEDDKNPAVQVLSAQVISIVDQRPPAAPDLSQGDDEKLPAGQRIYWLPNRELDFAGYEIGFGPDEDPNHFVYTRTIGLKDAEEERGMVSAQLWGLKDNESVFVGVRTFDVSGNYSDWSALSEVVPWDLSPHGWTPAPNSMASTVTDISVAFDSPLKPDSMAGALEVTDINGKFVPGESEFITNLNGDQILGLRYRPTVELTDGMTYTVKIVGGNDGVSTLDGRMMADHYRWKFIADATLNAPLPDSNTQLSLVLMDVQGTATPGSALSFSAVTPGAEAVDYLWTMGDGTQRPGATVEHAYNTEGDYVVTVTASKGTQQVQQFMTIRIISASARFPDNGFVHQLYLPFVTK